MENYTLAAMDNRATKMEALAKDLKSRYNAIVTDNETLWKQNIELNRRVKELEETLDSLMVFLSEKLPD